jgi:hypothetical protein
MSQFERTTGDSMRPSPRSQKSGLQAGQKTGKTRFIVGSCFCVLLLFIAAPSVFFGQAALLLEEPYGFFGTVNPTGHATVYLERVCAETPVHLRMCKPGETGVVISRYKGMDGYDWMAVPLLPYLYAVEDPSQVPAKADQEMVNRLREHYRETRLGELGQHLPPGGFFNGGWTELVGTAYDRETYVYRFQTTLAQDEKLVALLNSRPNESHFNIVFNNCADFDRLILGTYFPNQFNRNIFPDLGITTPKQITHKLTKYAKRHPETELTLLAIPQVPGFRHHSRSTDGVAETVLKNGYVLPIVVLNPYIAGGLLADYVVKGRYKVVPKNPEMLGPRELDALTQPQTLAQLQTLLAATGLSAAEPAKTQISERAGAARLTQPYLPPDNPVGSSSTNAPVGDAPIPASGAVGQHSIQK